MSDFIPADMGKPRRDDWWLIGAIGTPLVALIPLALLVYAVTIT